MDMTTQLLMMVMMMSHSKGGQVTNQTNSLLIDKRLGHAHHRLQSQFLIKVFQIQDCFPHKSPEIASIKLTFAIFVKR